VGWRIRELVNVTAPIRPIGGYPGRKKAPNGGYSKNGVLFIARDFLGLRARIMELAEDRGGVTLCGEGCDV
jgi:hypothetical protein